MRTIISFSIALILHIIIFLFLLPSPIQIEKETHPDLQTIDLTNFNIKRKIVPAIKPSNTARSFEGQVSPENLSNKNEPSNVAQERTLIENPAPLFSSFSSPVYPKLARAKGLEGKVKIKVTFNDEGKPRKIEIINSSGEPLLDDVVKKTAESWRASKGNTIFEKTFEFKLNN